MGVQKNILMCLSIYLAEVYSLGESSSSWESRFKAPRHSSQFGSGMTFFGFGGYHPDYPYGYVYDCAGPNSTVVRCLEANTTFTSEGDPKSCLRRAIFKQSQGYMTHGNENYEIYIINITTPLIWDDRKYFWNRALYKERENMTMCVGEVDQKTFKTHSANDDILQELVWACPMTEHCCDYECCAPENRETSCLVLLLLVPVIGLLCIIHCITPPAEEETGKEKDDALERRREEEAQSQQRPTAYAETSRSPESLRAHPACNCTTSADLLSELIDDRLRYLEDAKQQRQQLQLTQRAQEHQHQELEHQNNQQLLHESQIFADPLDNDISAPPTYSECVAKSIL